MSGKGAKITKKKQLDSLPREFVLGLQLLLDGLLTGRLLALQSAWEDGYWEVVPCENKTAFHKNTFSIKKRRRENDARNAGIWSELGG